MSEIFGFTVLKGKFKRSLDKSQLVTLFSTLASSCASVKHDALGVAVVNENEIGVLKRLVPPRELLTTQEYLNFMNKVDPANTFTILGQCREKCIGASEDLDDNYPLVAENIVGVFEGSTANATEVFTNHNHHFKKTTLAEGESVFKLFAYHKNNLSFNAKISMQRTLDKIVGFSNSIYVNAFTPSSVHILKKSINPLNVFVYEDVGLVVYAALTRHIIDSAKLTDLGEDKSLVMNLNSGITICARTSRYEKILE